MIDHAQLNFRNNLYPTFRRSELTESPPIIYVRLVLTLLIILPSKYRCDTSNGAHTATGSCHQDVDGGCDPEGEVVESRVAVVVG